MYKSHESRTIDHASKFEMNINQFTNFVDNVNTQIQI